MSWLAATIDRLKEAARAEPLQCPRGWGDVSFVVEVGAMWPFFSFERKCPISGSSACASCTYAFNPERVEALRVALEDLRRLREERVLTEDEYRTRRASILRFQSLMESGSGKTREAGFRITSWILGPLAVVFLLTGSWLGQTLHPGFWGVAGIGALLLALCISFAALANPRPEPESGFE